MNLISWLRGALWGTDGGDGTEDYGDEEEDFIEPENDSATNPFGGTARFSGHSEYNAYDDLDEEEEELPKPEPRTRGRKKASVRRPQSSNITPVTGRSNLNISLMMPKGFEDDEIQKAIQMLRDEGRTVILNLESCAESDKFVPFALGLVGGVDGHIDNVSQSIYILVPKNVELSGDFVDVESQAEQILHSKSV